MIRNANLMKKGMESDNKCLTCNRCSMKLNIKARMELEHIEACYMLDEPKITTIA